MFRVIYHWRVPRENFAEFSAIWAATTDSIHAEVEGAKGSFMLRSDDDPRRVLTIAKWASKTHWVAFWQDSNPEQMQKMRTLAERTGVETYTEIDDRSKP